MVNRMTEFYFLVQLIPRSKCMDNFFFIYSMFFYNILITKQKQHHSFSLNRISSSVNSSLREQSAE